jgi:ribosomal protein S18 acetylase RimI-like enzyme
MQIGEYKVQDRQAIVRLFDDFQEFLVDLDPLGRLQKPSRYGEAALSRTLEQIAESKGVFYIARENEHVIGCVVAVILPPVAIDDVGVVPATRGRITELYVDSRFRGRGVGQLLMAKAEKYLIESDCDFIKVEVFAPNTRAHDFYNRLGYQDYDIDMLKDCNLPSRPKGEPD